MQIAMIGLGRMGANMAQRLLRGGHEVVGFDPAQAENVALPSHLATLYAKREQIKAQLAELEGKTDD